MKIFLLLTLSLCAVQCSDVLIKVIQEAHIGNCKLGCNQCPQDGNTGNNTLALAQAKLTKLKVEQKELEEDVSEAETAESSVNSAGNATEDLTNAVQGTGRRRRRKRASDTVSLTSCEDPSAKLEGEVGTVILKVMAGIKKSLEAISENNLNITTLNCYIVLAVDLTNRLKTGTLNKPSDVSAIVTFSVTVQISVTTTRTTVVVIVTKRKEALVEKKQEVAAAKKEVVDAGGTVEGG
ncbi:uncharacterized protein LOC135216915 [Macrobrachium nipponense]|uniref:uncharacterized protein LOC135216915 n=1 Tax=Macrobrachium nipponense TaxID=159736 RepID=UPI0030C83CCB